MYLVSVAIEITCAVISFCMLFFFLLGKRKETTLDKLFILMLIFNILVLISDCNGYFLVDARLNFIHYAAIYISFFAIYMVSFLYVMYVSEFIRLQHGISKIYLKITVTFLVIGLTLLVIQIFNHMYFSLDSDGEYIIEDYFWINHVFEFLFIAIVASMVIVNHKKLSMRDGCALISICFVFTAFLVCMMILPDIPFVYFSMTLCLFIIYNQTHVTYYWQLKQIEADLSQARINIAMSQIQPHFIYNSLATIATLCIVDPKQAQKTTVDFSNYLRANLDSVGNNHAIPFLKELKHVQTYLALEKMRFEEKLNVIYDIECDSFAIPPLSIQPLAENAVRHGICKKAGNGTIKISTKELKHSYVVTVEDDGVGFDFREPFSTDRAHIGVANVKRRVKELVGGSLELTSEVGKGTTATIIIPKNY